VAKITHDGFDRPTRASCWCTFSMAAATRWKRAEYVEKEMNRDPEGAGRTRRQAGRRTEGEPVRNTVPANTGVLRLRSKNDRSREYSC